MSTFLTLFKSPIWFISFYLVLIISVVLPIHYFSSPVRQWKKMIKKYRDVSLFQGEKIFIICKNVGLTTESTEGVLLSGRTLPVYFSTLSFPNRFLFLG